MWARVVANTTPLRHQTLKDQDLPEKQLLGVTTERPAVPLPHRKQKGAPSPRPARAAPKPHPAPSLPLTGLDRRTEQRLKRGRIDVESILDLHGMTQSHAHMALRSFLVAAQARGDRLVLIITGKGSPQGARFEPEQMWGSGRGILRRLVPEWLSQPELSSWVSGFRNAHQRHGGGGALYVRIRRKRS